MQVGQVITQNLGAPAGEVIAQNIGAFAGEALKPLQLREPADDVDSTLAELDALGSDPETKDKVIAALVASNPEGVKPGAGDAKQE